MIDGNLLDINEQNTDERHFCAQTQFKLNDWILSTFQNTLQCNEYVDEITNLKNN